MTSARVTKGPPSSWTRTRSAKIVLDTTLLLAFLAEFFTREGPDYAIHSWVGIALIPVIAIHLTGNVGWIKRVWKRKRDDREFTLGLLNASLGALAAICIATGFPIWLGWSDASGWTTVHTVTGMAGLLIMFVHLWRNRARILRLIRPQGRPAT